MVQVTCKKCSKQLQFSDDDIPPSGKVVKCSQCGAPVTVMPAAAAQMGLPVDEVGGEALSLDDSDLLPLGGDEPLALDLEAPLDLAELDAPARPSPLAAAKPSAEARVVPKRSPFADAEVPAPKTGAKSPFADLPAPKAKPGAPPRPSIGGSLDADLPAPRAGGLELADLPAPKSQGPGLADLPAPKSQGPGLADLPAPKSTGPGLADLPAPKSQGPGLADLPAPKLGSLDLPDLPAPSKSLPDLLAPVEASPSADFDLPAPKGSGSKGLALDLDDIGLESSTAKTPPPPMLDLDPDPAPSAKPNKAAPPTPKPAEIGLDLGDALDLGPSTGSSTAPAPFDLDAGSSGGPALDFGGLDLGGGADDAGEPLSLDGMDLQTPDSGGGLELDMPSPAKKGGGPGGSSFDGLDLPDLGAGAPAAETKKSDGVVSFGKPSAAKSSKPSPARSKKKGKTEDGPIELDLGGTAGAAPIPVAKPRREPAPIRKAEGEDEEPAKGKSRKRTLIAVGAVAVLLIGAGGFFGFTRWQEKQERAAKLDAGVDAAEKALAKGQWNAAAKAAEGALAVEPNHARAAAMAVQGRLAAVIELGDAAEKAKNDTRNWSTMLGTLTKKDADIERAEGLRLLVEGQPGQAIKRLEAATAADPKNANGFLFLGWAYAANYGHEKAAAAFGKALKRDPNRIAALYGQAKAQLALGKNTEASATLSAIIEKEKNHVGALLGLAELAEASRFGDREKRFLEILSRDDIGKADPREVSRGWSLAGKEALLAGRTGEAADRFAKALKLWPGNLDAIVGEARAELADGRVDNALGKVTKVLGLDATHVDAQLTLAEVKLAKKTPDEALTAVDKVLDRKPPIQDRAALTRARMIRGSIYASQDGGDALAEDDFKAARETAAEGDIAPLVALSNLYNKMGRSEEAVALLEPVKADAANEPALAVTLGVAYLRSGDPAAARQWFETALARRPDDVEARFQLGLALAGEQDYEKAIAALEEAFKVSGQREDIGIRLARMYSEMGRQEDAYKQYEMLLAKESPSINLRSQAGRFFARVGDTDRAATMGEEILAEQPRNPAGLYLKGEALMAERKFKEARDLFTGASQGDPQPQFFEGLGRAHEGLDELNPALKAYSRAIEGDPRFLQPRLARSRIFVAQRRFAKALEELDDAAKVDASNAEIEFYRGKTFVAVKKYDDAITHLQRSIRLDSRPAEPHYQLGIAYYNSDKAGPAASALSTATHNANGDEDWLAEAYRVLGYSHRAAGNKSGAVSAWKNYLDRAERGSQEATEVKRLLARLQAP